MELVFVVVEQALDQYVEMFLRVKRATRRPRTVEWYANVLRYYKEDTRSLGRDWPPTVEHCLRFLERRARLSEASRNNYYRAFRSFLNWAVTCGLIQQNPLEYVDGPDNPNPLPKAPPQADMTKLLATVAAQAGERWEYARDLALFSLALDTGARISELAALQMSNLDLVNGQVRVYGTKDNKARELEIGDGALADLNAWLALRTILAPADNHIFVSNYQGSLRPLTSWGMRQALGRWQKLAGIEPFPFHGFRHAFAIYSLRNKADLLDVRDQMGHRSIKTTAVYTQVIDEGRKQRHKKSSPRSNLSLD